MHTRSPKRWVTIAVMALTLAAPSCAVQPDENDNIPGMTVDTAFLEELNRDAERQMEDMFRRNEEMFGTGDEPLRGVAP